MWNLHDARYYTELEGSTAEKFKRMSGPVYMTLIVLYSAYFCLGYLLFGSQVQAPFLSNFADTDTLAYICRWAYVIVSISMYPLVFSAGSARVYDRLKVFFPNLRFSVVAVALNLLIWAIGTAFDDVGQVTRLGLSCYISQSPLVTQNSCPD